MGGWKLNYELGDHSVANRKMVPANVRAGKEKLYVKTGR